MSLDTPHKDIEEFEKTIATNMGLYFRESDGKWLKEINDLNGNHIRVENMTAEVKNIMNLITTHTERAVVAEIDKKVIEVLGMYAEDVFTPTTKDDKDVFNKVNPNAHTRIHCGGIRHGLHQLRRVARDLSPRDDLEVIHVPPLQKGTNHV